MNEEFEIYETDTPITISKAYKELSKSAFSVWMRLMVANDEEVFGRKNIEETLCLSSARTTAILKELVNKRYILIHRKGQKGSCKVDIKKRAIIDGRTKFIKLSDFIFDGPASGMHNFAAIINPKPQENHLNFSPKSALALSAKMSEEKPEMIEKKHLKRQTKALTSFSHNNKLDIKALRERNEQIKQERLDKRVSKKHERSECFCKNVSFLELQRFCVKQKMKGNIPGPTLRKKFIKILNRERNNPGKLKLVKQIGEEFKALYVEYRLLLLASKNYSWGYTPQESETKCLRSIAENCIRSKISYVQLLEYWHDKVPNLAEKKMKVPPLSFLAGENISDTVRKYLDKKNSKKKNKTKIKNSFGDVGKLNPKLRLGLNAAGFDTTDLSDRVLMSVQLPAQDIADGFDIFVSKSLRPFVDWAVENLYRK